MNKPNNIVRRETRRKSLGIQKGSRTCKCEKKFLEEGESKLIRECYWKNGNRRGGKKMEGEGEKYLGRTGLQ